MVRELDLRAGGRYRLEGNDRRRPWRVGGPYLEVTPPSKLVYTWSWDNDPALGDPLGRDTLVTVEFIERGSETEVVVTHERPQRSARARNTTPAGSAASIVWAAWWRKDPLETLLPLDDREERT